MSHIRIISPSGAIDPALMDVATKRLQRWGHTVSEGRYARGKWGRFSGTDEERLSDLSDALSDPSVDFILCSRGGYGLQRIIARLPFNEVSLQPSGDQAAKRPTLIGFSDITELHQIWQAPSLHGLMCKHIATLPEDADPIRYWRDALEGKSLHYTLPAHPMNRIGNATGTLIGGNLSVLYGLQSTPYGLTEQRYILFIEDIAERHYHIERMILNLKMSGVLAGLSGLIIGQFSDCEDDPSMNETIYETIRRHVDEYDYPVLFNFPAGHIDYNLPLWLNKPCTITVTHEGVTFYE